jgi:hypothetical protein
MQVQLSAAVTELGLTHNNNRRAASLAYHNNNKFRGKAIRWPLKNTTTYINQKGASINS